MADFTAAKDSLIMSMALSSGSSSSTAPALDDDFDNSCSICLEPFTLDDPSTVTTCKHEYHLHCIIEWSQRSKECPTCWQSLALKDPASQELLATVEIERNASRRHVLTTGPIYPLHYQESDSEYGSHWTDDSDFNERIMQHLAAMMNRARQTHRNVRQRSSERRHSLTESIMHPNSPEECSPAGSSPTSSISSVDPQPPLSPHPAFISLSFCSSSPKRDGRYNLRSLQSQSPDFNQRSRSSELLGFSESIKSRLSAASSRYKDSISKGTQGFKEKFLARNSSVIELSKGVQREMRASMAGVAQMIERLDLKSKQNSHSADGLTHAGETSNFFSKGKGVLDNIIANSGDNHLNHLETNQGLKLDGQSRATCSLSSPKEFFRAEKSN